MPTISNVINILESQIQIRSLKTSESFSIFITPLLKNSFGLLVCSYLQFCLGCVRRVTKQVRFGIGYIGNHHDHLFLFSFLKLYAFLQQTVGLVLHCKKYHLGNYCFNDGIPKEVS